MTARFLSIVSSEMISVAVGWQIYGLTHRPLDLGLVGLAQFAPGVLLFLVAGHTADRHPRQSILRICYARVCGLLRRCCWLSHSEDSPRYGRFTRCCWPMARCGAFNGPAGQAFLPQLVKPEHFPNAVTWSSSFFQTATILGPMVGGLIYGFAGSPAPVYACATVAYLTAVLLLSAIRVDIASRKNLDEPVGPDPGRAPLHLAQQVDSRLHVAGSFCRAAGRRGGAAAGLRERNPTHRSRTAWECCARRRAWAPLRLRFSLRIIRCGAGPDSACCTA